MGAKAESRLQFPDPRSSSSLAAILGLGRMAVFSGCQIALELDSSLPFKKKKAVKRDVIDNGGVVSFIVTKKVRDVLESPLLPLPNVFFLLSSVLAGHALGGE